ncbi:MAG: peptidylprolyl isomerase [Clostridia bacterium]|nr:peptidylprolyl isomerase [Clostridia bacterium]
MKSKSILALVLCLVICLFAVGCDKNSADYKVTHNVLITMEDYGEIELELYGELAPLTVENFVKLVKDGFYDGLTFHRIIDGFMIQGGDPKGTGAGGSGTTIKGEFSNNGIENDLSHTRGVISMARYNNYDSASSQFFIVHNDSPHLDGDYAAFGKVTKGMEVVDLIVDDAVVEDDNGKVHRLDQPVIKSIKILE